MKIFGTINMASITLFGVLALAALAATTCFHRDHCSIFQEGEDECEFSHCNADARGFNFLNDVLTVGDNNGDLQQSRAFIIGREFLWPFGIIYYEIDPSIPSSDWTIILESMKHIECRTDYCITFVLRIPILHRNFVRIMKGNGCTSNVGMIGGAQNLSLGDGCMHKTVIIHELCHAIGFQHEHQRPDRDEHLTVITANVDPGDFHNFDLLTLNDGSKTDEYDFCSIMHYDNTTFGINCAVTMEPKDPTVEWPKVCKKDGLSVLDVKWLKKKYNCLL